MKKFLRKLKKILGYLWKAPKIIYCWINETERNFLQQFNADYKSKLALHSLILLLILPLGLIGIGIISAGFASDLEDLSIATVFMGLPFVAIPILYIFLYLRKRLRMIAGEKQKYCTMATIALLFGGNAIILPILLLIIIIITIIKILIMLGIIAIYIVTGLVALWIVLTIISIANGDGIPLGGGSGKKRKWKLNDGDTVTEEKDLFGEKHYRDSSGREYDKTGTNTFREKE